MKIRFAITTGLFLLLLSSCSFFRNFNNIQLDNVILEPGTNFDEIYTGEIINLDKEVLRVLSATRGKHQELLLDEEGKGSIRILLYRSSFAQSKAFSDFTMLESQEGIIPKEYPKIGDASEFFATNHSLISVFRECEALILISLPRRGQDNEDAEIVWEMTMEVHDNVLEYVCK